LTAQEHREVKKYIAQVYWADKELVRNYGEWIPSKSTVGRDNGNALSRWLSKVRLRKNNQVADTRV
jgi:hypothetical protein